MNGFWVHHSALPVDGLNPDAKVKLLLIGGFVGLAIGVGLTILYFSLATFFEVNARALNGKKKAAENSNETSEDSIATDSRKAG